MTWFKVDDGFHKHRKRVRTGISLEGLAAIGLWAIAGSWASDELTDGWIPDDVLDYLAPEIGQELAKRLERSTLWHRVTRDGEDGWQYHQWTDHQPSKEQVLAERAAAADRQRRARERAKQKRDNGGQEAQDEEASRRDSRVTDTATHGGVTPAVTVPPTRPDPTRPELPTKVKNQAARAASMAAQSTLDGMPDPPESSGEIKANDIVAAFVDASVSAGLEKPTTGIIGRVSRDAKRLLTKEKVDPQRLLEAARITGENGWQSIEAQLRRLDAERIDQERRNGQGRRNGSLSASSRANGATTGANRHQDPPDRKPFIVGVVASEVTAQAGAS